MKVAIAQLSTIPGDLSGNRHKIHQACLKAKASGAALIVLPDGALSGTPLLDMASNPDFSVALEQALQELAVQMAQEIEIVTSETENSADNALIHLRAGAIVRQGHHTVSINGESLAIYPAAEMFSHHAPQRILEQMKQAQSSASMPLLYANQAGAATDIVWSGGSFVITSDQGRQVVSQLPLFEACVQIFDLNNPPRTTVIGDMWGDKIEAMHAALVIGIRDYFTKNNFTQACVALSGGIDSAVVVALAVEALGAGRVRVVMLPSAYSSDHSVDDSVEMVRRCGIRGDRIFIGSIFDEAVNMLIPVLDGEPSGLAHENMQSRIRLMLTMALSNQTGALMLNTSNKSEVAVGYGTLYGDTSGALGVIADLYKCEVYALARHINETCGNPIPQNIIDKAPSAELRPDQKDSDSLPDYPILDRLLHLLIEERRTVHGILNDLSLPEELRNQTERVAKLVWRGDFKRHQLPPPIRVSGATFGYERRMPITKGSDFCFL